jgi:uncharacterized protein (DUF1778 family)
MQATSVVNDHTLTRARPKEEKLSLRVKAGDKDTIREGAEIAGQTLSEFLISKGLEAARQIIAEAQTVCVNKEAYDRFVAALEAEPEAPSTEAIQAVIDYRTSIKEDQGFDW